MSEEKKATWGSAPASQEPRQEPQASSGAAQPAVMASQATDADEPDTEPPARGRNQNVLPGILGKQLRTAYGELLNSPVPDRITDLIKQLETKQAGKPAGSKSHGGEESK
jgi:hypothetical protein